MRETHSVMQCVAVRCSVLQCLNGPHLSLAPPPFLCRKPAVCCSVKHTHIHTYIHAKKQTYKQKNIHAHLHTNIHTRIRTCVNTCIHTYMLLLSPYAGYLYVPILPKKHENMILLIFVKGFWAQIRCNCVRAPPHMSHIRPRLHTHAFKHTHTHTHIHKHIHTYTHTHVKTHTNTRTYPCTRTLTI